MKSCSSLKYSYDSSFYKDIRSTILKSNLANTKFPINIALDLLGKFGIVCDSNDTEFISYCLNKDFVVLAIGRYAIISNNIGTKLLKTNSVKLVKASDTNLLFKVVNNNLQVGNEVESILPKTPRYFTKLATIRIKCNLTFEEIMNSNRLIRKRGYI